MSPPTRRRPATMLVLMLVTTAAHAAPPATQPASRPAAAPQTVAAAFSKLPRDARPAKGEWTAFAAGKATQWAKEHVADTTIADAFRISRVEVKAVQGDWQASVFLQDHVLQLDRQPVGVAIIAPPSLRGGTHSINNRFPLVFVGDDQFGKAASQWKEGDQLRLEIDVDSATASNSASTDQQGNRSVGTISIRLRSSRLTAAGAYRPNPPVAAATSPAK